MNLRHGSLPPPELNITPLIDVVFLLLIFFMVSTTFDKETELVIELPEVSSESTPQEEQLLEVAVSAQGRYRVNGQAVDGSDLANLQEALAAAATDRRDLPVVVRADGQAPHQAVMTVLDAAGRLGLARLTFAARSADVPP